MRRTTSFGGSLKTVDWRLLLFAALLAVGGFVVFSHQNAADPGPELAQWEAPEAAPTLSTYAEEESEAPPPTPPPEEQQAVVEDFLQRKQAVGPPEPCDAAVGGLVSEDTAEVVQSQQTIIEGQRKQVEEVHHDLDDLLRRLRKATGDRNGDLIPPAPLDGN